MEFGLHVGQILLPFTAGRTVVESVCIGVDVDELELAAYSALHHCLKLGVFVGKLHIRPYLRSRVAEPHGVDVAGIHECIVLAILTLAVMYGGVDSIGETVLEHPCKLLVLELLLHLGDFFLDGLRLEETVFGSRAIGFCIIYGSGSGVVAGAYRSRNGISTERCSHNCEGGNAAFECIHSFTLIMSFRGVRQKLFNSYRQAATETACL